MNVVKISGKLQRDPDLRTTQNGHQLCTFSVAVDRPPTKEGQIYQAYIPCQAWGRAAANIGKMFGGDQIYVEGRINTRSFQRKDGTKGFAVEVVVDSFSTEGIPDDSTKIPF